MSEGGGDEGEGEAEDRAGDPASVADVPRGKDMNGTRRRAEALAVKEGELAALNAARALKRTVRVHSDGMRFRV